MQGNNHRIFVLNSSHPEVDRLAAALDQNQELELYVRRYAMQDRAWEKILQRTPLLSSLARPITRRRLPPGLRSEYVVEAGVLADLTLSLLSSLPSMPLSKAIAKSLLLHRDRQIARKGARLGARSSVCLANYSVAKEVFSASVPNGTRRLLNYPTAHHHYTRKLLDEEALLEPAFRQSLNIQVPPPGMAARLDKECELADKILVGSSFANRSFIAEGIDPAKVVTVNYGCDVSDSFFPAAKSTTASRFRVLFVGQVTQRKGISYLFRGYSEIRDANTELIVAGKYVGSEEACKPHSHLFKHLGHVSRDALPELYRSADVLVLPTLIEGLPLVVVEAMACGIPVIVTPNGPEDIVRDGVDGFVVPIRSPEAIATRLQQLKENPELRKWMGVNARQRALHFTWTRYVQQAMSVIVDDLN